VQVPVESADQVPPNKPQQSSRSFGGRDDRGAAGHGTLGEAQGIHAGGSQTLGSLEAPQLEAGGEAGKHKDEPAMPPTRKKRR
jgi:hypothetical protein